MSAAAKAIVYLRVSPRGSKGDRSGNEIAAGSIETQRELVMEFCKSKEYEVVEVFEDLEKSGDDDHREGLWGAVAATRRHRVLVVWKWDRLARSVFTQETVSRMLDRQGGSIESVVEGKDETIEDEMTRKILAVVAEYEKKLISARTSTAMKLKQQQGARMSREDRPPYGQQQDPSDPTKLIVDERQQRVIKSICDYREQGKTYRQIVELLEIKGEPSPTGSQKWYPATVQRIVDRHQTHPVDPAHQ